MDGIKSKEARQGLPCVCDAVNIQWTLKLTLFACEMLPLHKPYIVATLTRDMSLFSERLKCED